jgi:nucleotide-binding universal stress UspA family protein
MNVKILAPTRGGELSQPNQDWVISYAREHQAELEFLYITDLTVFDQHSTTVLISLQDELDEMGRFVLAMAQERAAKKGVEAGAIVRRGQLRDVLDTVIKEEEIDVVILGSPAEETAVTTVEYLRDLVRELAEEHKVETIVLQQGELLLEHKPDA